MRKVTFAVGFAVGYVLGSRAGRERYDQIARLARGLADNPAVQSAAGLVQAQAASLVGTATKRAKQTVTSAVGGRDVTEQVSPYPDSFPES